MQTKQKSFIMYIENIDYLEQLSLEQIGMLTLAIFRYAKDGEWIETDEPTLRLLFQVFAKQIDHNAEKYEKMCEKNRKNGKLGGRPPKENPVGFSKTLNDNDNKTDNDNDYDNDNERHENILVTRGKEKINNFD